MKVILADDSAVTSRLLEAVIVECGHEVTCVDDGQAAWEAFEREPTPMVILDWMMPRLDGIELCRRIRARERGDETFVLMVTGRGTTEDLASALDAGADDFITKPVSIELLRARLVIAERRMADSAARRRAEDALSRAQWLAGIGQTSLAMQHEINNPLTALLAEAEILATDPATPADHREPLATIVAQARRIAAVVRQLSALHEPRSVEYLDGVRMLDLSTKAASAPRR
jgi:DNA-binding response OmpR family regulator